MNDFTVFGVSLQVCYTPGVTEVPFPRTVAHGGHTLRRIAAPHDALRAALVLDSRPLRQIAREASVPHPSIVRFANGKRSLSPRSFDRVAGILGLELRPSHSGPP